VHEVPKPYLCDVPNVAALNGETLISECCAAAYQLLTKPSSGWNACCMAARSLIRLNQA
jgi:hypothetical protein